MEYSGFFNGDQEYGQEEFNRYFDNIYESGISINDDNSMTLGVTTISNGVQVSKGFAIVKGFYLYNDSDKLITIARDTYYDRIDRIVLRLNLSSSKVSIELKQGVASSKPVAPVLQRDNLTYELSLAQVVVPKVGTLVVTDERYRKELCGAIRPKNLTELNEMLSGLQLKFDRWFSSQQAKGWRNIFIQSNEPTGVVAGGIWIQTVT